MNAQSFNLTFTVKKIGGAATVDDARRLGSFLDDDTDALSFEGGGFILDDVWYDDPQCFMGRLELSFTVRATKLSEDSKITDDELRQMINDSAILYLPNGYEVKTLETTL